MNIKIENRLGLLAKERGIKSAVAFGEKMTKEQGLKLSASQASRYMGDNPPSFSQDFIQAACELLQCLPNELFSITITLDAEEEMPITMEVPRHAIVLRKKEPTPKPAQKAKAEKVKVVNKDGGDKKVAPSWSDDVGPSADIFPFG